MAADLLHGLTNVPDVWGEGALFAFSGMDGPTDVASGFVASYGPQAFDLLFHTPRRRVLELRPPGQATVPAALGDVLAASSPAGPLLVTFSAWHSVVGLLPPGATVRLRLDHGPPAEGTDAMAVSADPDGADAVALARRADRFALSYGRSADQARARAEEALAADARHDATDRLAIYRSLPVLADAGRDRLLKKCLSVMKVNTCTREGAIPLDWTTPDRVPHRHMWIWDSVFHSLALNRISPALSRDSLLAVLSTQQDNGRIPLMTGVGGQTSPVTQPPLLAWGIWQNFQVTGDADMLAVALPRLGRWIDWIFAQRDRNGNGLPEWFIQPSSRSRCGESGLDNSPRFDCAQPLDAVDFSVYVAQEMDCLARMARRLGDEPAARRWQARAADTGRKIHDYLWDEADGFYYDRMMDGSFNRVRAVTGFWPMLLADIPPARVGRLVAALRDPRQFNTPCPAPSVAVSEPTWSTDLWRGATWCNTNYLLIEALARRGRHDDARWLAERTVAMVRRHYERHGVLFEFFDAKDEVPPPACHRKGPPSDRYDLRGKIDAIRDYHWTAALTACLLWPA